MARLRDSFDVHRIHETAFGAPVREDGHTLIPVSRVVGGGGSLRVWPFGDASGGVVRSRPLGVYSLDATGAHWRSVGAGGRRVLGAALLGTVVVTAAVVLTRRSRDRDQPELEPPT